MLKHNQHLCAAIPITYNVIMWQYNISSLGECCLWSSKCYVCVCGLDAVQPPPVPPPASQPKGHQAVSPTSPSPHLLPHMLLIWLGPLPPAPLFPLPGEYIMGTWVGQTTAAALRTLVLKIIGSLVALLSPSLPLVFLSLCACFLNGTHYCQCCQYSHLVIYQATPNKFFSCGICIFKHDTRSITICHRFKHAPLIKKWHEFLRNMIICLPALNGFSIHMFFFSRPWFCHGAFTWKNTLRFCLSMGTWKIA